MGATRTRGGRVKRRVYVVDDDPRVQIALRHLLSTSDDLETTGDAADADVALVDVLLPDLDRGLALIRTLAHRLPVVALSVSTASRDAALAAGARRFCDKDGGTDVLLDALRTTNRY